jgi:YidC/Oxa1 family membrane protein insertase
MDKNSIIGIVLIVLIFLGYYQITKPTKEQLEAQRRYNDSIALVQQVQAKAEAVKKIPVSKDSLLANDTTSKSDLANAYGDFSVAAFGKEQFYTLENKLVKLSISNKGGRIYSAQLKNYTDNNKKPLILFDGEESSFGFTLVTKNNRVMSSSDLYFEPLSAVITDIKGNQSITLRLKTAGAAYIDFVYTLPYNDYMLNFDVKGNDMNSVMPTGTNSLELKWISKIRQQEKGRKFENRYTQLSYKFLADDVEKLSEGKDDTKELTTKVRWIAFKDQFFSSILIADNSFTSTTLSSKMETDSSKYLKTYTANTSVAFDPTGKTSTNFRMYLGPNQYKILSSYDKGKSGGSELKLNDLIPLGWGIFGWINKLAIIPMFNFFSGFLNNFGLIILLLTIVIKLVLFPLTYKSFISSAKMRVLKPEIDELTAKIPADKTMERQKVSMDVYSKVGVSPMAGCLPALLQMPFLLALFNFFPAAIELRHQSFLWATDLSTYDSILSWNTYIPLITPYFGNHISLFCVLFTAATIVSTKLNMDTQGGGTEQVPGMKWIMYLMPLMFMVIFNSYASGLSYYYFISTMITLIQTYAIRASVDEKKLLAQLHAKRNNNAKKPAKKSGFMERLEKMQQEQQKAIRTRKK